VARATTRFVALASTLSVVAGLSLTATAGTAFADSGTAAGHDQAIVTLAGSHAVTVPGVHVQALLGAVHSEVVSGDTASLAALANAPGVLGMSPNAVAHLEGFAYGKKGKGNGDDDGNNNGNNDGNNNGNNNGGDKGNSSDPSTSDGVLAPSTLGGDAGKSDSGRGVTVALIDTGVSDTDALNRALGQIAHHDAVVIRSRRLARQPVEQRLIWMTRWTVHHIAFLRLKCQR